MAAYIKTLVDKDSNQIYPVSKAEAVFMENNKTTVQAAIQSLRNMSTGPLVAKTKSEMTDASKVYVYSGSETGMTFGDWYYYDGSAWVSGGAYNSLVVDLDNTLTESGKAPDSKVVGDEIGNLKSDFDQLVPGLTDEAKAALLACFAHVAWVDEHGQDCYDALEEALGVEPVKPIITLADWTYPIGTPVDKGFTQSGNAPSDDGSGLYFNTAGGYTYTIPNDETIEKFFFEATITPSVLYNLQQSSNKYDGIRFQISRGNIAINSLGIIYVENPSPSQYTSLMGANIGTAYKIAFEVDVVNSKANIYINDVLIGQDLHIDMGLNTARLISTTGTAKYRLNSISFKKQ